MDNKKFFSFLRAALRRMWLKWPARAEILKKSRRTYKGDNKRQKFEYQCNKCKKWFKQKNVQVDHIKQCGKLSELNHIQSFVTMLFCSIDNLQVMCLECHKIKSKEERKEKK